MQVQRNIGLELSHPTGLIYLFRVNVVNMEELAFVIEFFELDANPMAIGGCVVCEIWSYNSTETNTIPIEHNSRKKSIFIKGLPRQHVAEGSFFHLATKVIVMRPFQIRFNCGKCSL